MKRKGYTFVELLVTILIIALLMFGVTKCSLHVKKNAYKIMCGTNMKALGVYLTQYASDHQGQYPTPDKWCDILLEQSDVRLALFQCRTVPIDRFYHSNNPNEPNPNLKFSYISSDTNDPNKYIYEIKISTYALNPNAAPKSSKDVVLLFESTPGWNKFGGKEILAAEYHRGKRCNILFNNGSVKFIRPEDVNNLNWGEELKE